MVRIVNWVGPRRVLVAVLALGFGLCWISVQAQSLERHLPPEPAPPPATIEAPAPPGPANDDRVLSPHLRAIILLGAENAVSNAPMTPGLDTSAVSRMDRPSARKALSAFLGRPLSRRLIGQIEAQIVRQYRAQGVPFVEVSTPEQEITDGVLQIRVVEFHIGEVRVAGAGSREAAHIRRAIRSRRGDEIDVHLLSQDLDWLNRYPGRFVSLSLTPGARLGESDMDLAVSKTRPWSVTLGYANSGSHSTGRDRYFVGGSIAGHGVTDAVFSFQVTGSPDFWEADNQLFGNHHPLYESAAGRLLVATAPRQDIELSVDAIETNETIFPFVSRQQTVEASLGYRSALSNIVPLPGDLSGGVEASRQTRSTLFGGVDVLRRTVDVFQVYAGWSDHWSDPFGSTAIDLSLHISPGALDRFDTGVAFSAFTEGRMSRAAYQYGAVEVTRRFALPFRFSLVSQFYGQYAGRPIPDSRQIALGGPTAVRGYSLDDGAWDDGVVLRNELHGPVLPIVRRGQIDTELAPMIFADYGFGRDEAARRCTTISSIGAGLDLRLARGASASFAVSRPMTDAKVTRAGQPHLDARLIVAF